MSSTYALQTRPIAVELHSLLRDLDSARWHRGMEEALRSRFEQLRTALESLRSISSPDDGLNRLMDRISELETLLAGHRAVLSEAAEATREEWSALRQRFQPAYEALAQTLRANDIHVPSLRPTNYRRNLIHFAGSLLALVVILLIPTPAAMITAAAAFFTYAWSMEFLRRRSKTLNDRLMAYYGPLAHPHEWHRVNSATWYCTALLTLALTGSPLVCAVAVLVLGIGDPAAAVVGRRWGRIRLLYGRSLEGSLTFVATATALTLAALTLFFGELSLLAALGLSFTGAVFGATAELFSRRIDDNLTIPVAAGLGVWLIGSLSGTL